MSADQTPTLKPAPITQRDGSSLANANCRMASIATGLAYHSAGAQKSTGAKMRSYTDDQSGGTDSGDARQSWSRGYDRDLTVRDGRTFGDLLADLAAGRMVHVDVWHAAVDSSGVCHSGSGAYGHTMAVLPDCKDGAWLVNDPWCNPPKWARVSEAELRQGAETWGGKVYTKAAEEPDWPTSGPIDPRGAIVLAIVRRIVKRLMDDAYPGHPGELGDVDPPDTGGAQPILYTVTKPQPLTGGEDVGIAWRPQVWADPGIACYLDSGCTKKITTTTAGGEVTTLGAIAAKDPDGADYTALAIVVTTSHLADDGRSIRAVLWCKRDDLGAEPIAEDVAWNDSLWALAAEPSGRWPCGDDGGGEDPETAYARGRAEEWDRWYTSMGIPAEPGAP